MFITKKRFKTLVTEIVTPIETRIEVLEAKLAKKYISDNVEEETTPFAQIMDEWLNGGKENSVNGK